MHTRERNLADLARLSREALAAIVDGLPVN
jgi:hypothetical protein